MSLRAIAITDHLAETLNVYNLLIIDESGSMQTIYNQALSLFSLPGISL